MAGEQPPAEAEGAPAGVTGPSLRIDRDGEWFDGEAPITHPGLLAGLRANLRRDDAGYFIQTRVRVPVRVDDTPTVVVRLELRQDGLLATMNDGTRGGVDPASIRFGAGHVPYCRVSGGLAESRLSRAAAHQLIALGELEAAGRRLLLSIGGRRWVIEAPP